MPVEAVLLDKDGTLIEDVPYNADPARVRLVPGAAAAARAWKEAGFRLAVVSNQSGVGRGIFPEEALEGVWARLNELLGTKLDGFFYCPHVPEAGCDCRKPAPGLLLRAASELGADPRCCWLVGDILDDVEAGRRAGCRTILIDNGNETEWRAGPHRVPEYRAPDLLAAARVILEERGCA